MEAVMDSVVCQKPVGELGRIVIPQILRDRLGLHTGTLVDLRIENDRLVIEPSRRKVEHLKTGE